MAEPSHKKPGTSALQQNTRSTIPFFAWGSADVAILLKSSYYISFNNRLIAFLYVKVKEKQLKQSFGQLGATSIFTLTNAKGCGHSTAKERKHHIQTVALGTRQSINTLKRSEATGNVCRGSDSKSKDFRSCWFGFFVGLVFGFSAFLFF